MIFRIVLFLIIPVTCLCLDLGILGFLSNIKNVIKYNSVSLLYEHCDQRWVTANFSGLEEELSEKLFGQPLVMDVVLNALRGHFYNEHRRKPLVLSFHGGTGSGKTYVAEFILKHMFKNGLKSNFVRRYNAKKHFPVQRNVDLYQERLHKEIKETVSRCGHSIFVFDEVDKYPQGVLDAVKPYLDYSELVDDYDFRKAVFIFLTNNGQGIITSKTLEFWNQSVHRNDFLLRDFEKILKELSFNDEGGFYRSELIKSHLIDHYVPFLPLEKEHVIQCIEYEMRLQGVVEDTLQHQVEEVVKDLTFGPQDYELYSVSGCKIVSAKVSEKLEKYRNKTWKKKLRKEL